VFAMPLPRDTIGFVRGPISIADENPAVGMAPRVFRYGDMTDEQRAIVDAGLRPPAGTVPANLNPQELLEWVRTMAGMTA
jgi:hypothetical protein